MTESDEKLSRLFAVEASECDPAFTDAVEARLRRARLARRAIRTINLAAFVVLALAAWYGWQAAEPAFAEKFDLIPAFRADILGAPMPALAVLASGALWFVFRRFSRPA